MACYDIMQGVGRRLTIPVELSCMLPKMLVTDFLEVKMAASENISNCSDAMLVRKMSLNIAI